MHCTERLQRVRAAVNVFDFDFVQSIGLGRRLISYFSMSDIPLVLLEVIEWGPSFLCELEDRLEADKGWRGMDELEPTSGYFNHWRCKPSSSTSE